MHRLILHICPSPPRILRVQAGESGRLLLGVGGTWVQECAAALQGGEEVQKSSLGAEQSPVVPMVNETATQVPRHVHARHP
jgi:hypothetical protein